MAHSIGSDGSDGYERPGFDVRARHEDEVPRGDVSAGQHYCHDASEPHQITGIAAPKYCRLKPGMKALKLAARVPEAGHLNECAVPELEAGAGGKSKEIDTTGSDVFAHVSGGNGQTEGEQRIVEFTMDEVDLAKVGLHWVLGHSRPMFHCDPKVRIALHPEPGQEADLTNNRLGHGVGGAHRNRRNSTAAGRGLVAVLVHRPKIPMGR